MNLRERIFLGLAGALAASAVLAAPAAAQAPIRCGDTITVSTTLTRDLVGCAGNGLVIGADGITIDLAGHSIRGINARGSSGIVDNGHAGVTIANGKIADFFASGVSLHGAPRSIVRDVRVVRIGAGGVEPETSAGILIEASAETRVSGSTIAGDVESYQSDGVVVLRSPNVILSCNRIERNSWNGAVVLESPGSQIVGNALDDNGNQGIEANAASDGIVLAGNRARGNTQSGLVVGALSDGRVIGNRVSGNGDAGLFMFDLVDSLVAGNVAERNVAGIVLIGGQFGSHGNRLFGNRTDDNDDVGIVLDGQANSNQVVGNVARGNRGPDGGGIIVVASTGNLIAGNLSSDNASVGIGIFEGDPGDSVGNSLARNVANANGGHGIDAIAGSIDGGGNRAHRNRTPPDCVGVTCS
jgi:parallel beta-helix repeat protein